MGGTNSGGVKIFRPMKNVLGPGGKIIQVG